MPLFDAMNISASGLTTNRKWIDAVSDNIANVNNVSSMDEAAFQERFVAARANSYGQPEGVHIAGNMWGDPNGRVVEMPGHPLADAQGRVRVPNINLSDQMASLMLAQRAYQANASSAERAKTVYEAAIGIGR